MSNTYYFLIGRTPELSIQELKSVLPDQELIQFTEELVRAELESDEQAMTLFKQLGGSLKVMKQVGVFNLVDEESLLDYIAAYLAQFPKPTFAIAEINRQNIPKIENQFIKNRLKARNISSRFIEGSRSGLTAAVLTHQDLIELVIIRMDEDTMFTHTLATQDIDDWTRRDRVKPYADRKKGMLPPKLARMMTNLARGNWKREQRLTPLSQLKTPFLYDPFCGSGTVLLEALMLELPVSGSDIDQDAVRGTQNNLDWFSQMYQSQIEAAVFYSDATLVTSEQLKTPVDLLVTEPFLGKPNPQEIQLPNIFKGLEKLYWGAFRQWTKILADQAVLVIIFPYVEAGKTVYALEKLIDKLAVLGYTPVSEPIMYHRPQAVVQRQIWQFVFHKK